MDIIEIDNLRLRCIIGFSPHERKDRQDVVISLRLGTDLKKAGETDNPDDTFNYRTVTKAIIKHVEQSDYFLVEKLAGEIARICIVDFDAPYIQVRVHKPGALRFSDTVGVMIERTPADYTNHIAYISLGSNINPEQNVPEAIGLLGKYTSILAVSSIYVTAPQGYTDQADFWNLAVKVQTYRTPAEFKSDVIDRIEQELHRERDPNNKNAPRTIDLDISLWGEEVLEYGDKPWQIPDPDALKFAHIAVPLADIAPELVYPSTHRTLQSIVDDMSLTDINIWKLDGSK